MNISDKLEDATTDLQRRISKIQYTKIVYDRINVMMENSDDGMNQELRILSGALSEGIKISLGLLGVEGVPSWEPDAEQLEKDVMRILTELQAQFPKD